MNENRNRSLHLLGETAGVPVELVTEENMTEWVLHERPIPPDFSLLQPIQKADYLKAYLVCIHGGGYSDIKQTTASWEPAFQLIAAGEADVVGYPLQHRSHVASFGLPPTVQRKIALWNPKWWRRLRYMLAYSSLMGGGAFIFRPQTVIANQYLGSLDRLLAKFGAWWRNDATPAERQALDPEAEFTDYSEVLRRQSMIYNQKVPGYPLHWGSMAMDIQQPLSLRFQSRVSLSLPSPVLTDYR